MKLSYDTVAAAVNMADLDPAEIIYPSYTGRYAREGFGFRVEMIGDAFQIMLYLAENGVDAHELADRVNMDGMGHGTIVYFPGILLDGAPEDDDMEDDDDD
jgi:hypothetical protein